MNQHQKESSTRARLLKGLEHYAAHGVNASIIARTEYLDPMPSDSNARKLTTLAFRKGRADKHEAVQVEVTVETVGKSRTISRSSSVSFDQATWDAIVAFVKKDRTVKS